MIAIIDQPKNQKARGFTPAPLLKLSSRLLKKISNRGAVKPSSPNGKVRGFTLLELLIVIAILAILSVALIIVLNPAETLKKSRDVQRISDLNTMKTAIGLYTTSISTPQLDGKTGTVNDKCDGGTAAAEELWVSVNTTAGGGETITDTPPVGWPALAGNWEQNAAASTQPEVDADGWIPIDFTAIPGGAPISNLPIDPTNDVSINASTAAIVDNTALMYRYACKKSTITYELNANLESDAFTVTDNKETKDGGNNTNLYEVGTDLSILTSTNDF